MSNPKSPKPHASVKDFYTIADVAALLCTSENRVREFASRRDDPLPLRRLRNRKRGTSITRMELQEWVTRNSVLVNCEKARAQGKDGKI